jgi:3-oxoadipate enol-lactonase
VTDDIRWVERPGGVRLPYIVQGSGDRPRLLFAHSLLAGAIEGRAIFDVIVDAGWTVLVIDHRGHGLAQKDGPWTAEDFDLDLLGADLLATLDDAGWDTAWLGGGSMGAATSLAATIAAPERAEGLLLMAPAIGAEVNPGLEIFLPVADAFERSHEEGLAAWNERSGAGPNPLHVRAFERLGSGGAAALLRSIAAWRFGPLPSFDVPVVTSAWENDPVHPKATAVALADASPAGTFHPLDLGVDPNFFAHVARQLTAAVA